MLTANDFSDVYLSALLRQKAPSVAATLQRILEQEHIPVHWLQNTRDIWCRDYMPVWVNKEECVQFVFDPAYYKYKKYQSWRTEPYDVTSQLNIHPYFCGVVLDGGNIVNTTNEAIVTERIFKDNLNWEEDRLLNHIKDHLQVERLVVIPEIPGDCTGHIDGMMRIVDGKTVILNDLGLIVQPAFYRHIRLCLYNAGFDIVIMPNQLHINRSTDDNTGDYINYLEIGELMIIPEYGNDLDKEVLDIYGGLFPNRKILQVDISTLAPMGGGLNCISWCRPYNP